MKIAVLKERRPYEKRVAATPETVKKYIDAGYQVVVEKGAGEGSSLSDQAFTAVGAQIASSYQDALKGAQVVLKVQRPLTAEEGTDELGALEKGTVLIGLLAPYASEAMLKNYAERQITSLSMEMLPRITRAQSMDVLSSQTNLAGYRAVIEAGHLFDRAFPMMMTAAGTIAPARVLILGAGVAGLQAIATARRLGAVVSAFDVRDVAKEQVESLGATFITVENTSSGDDGRGYAQKMDDDYQARQAARIAEALKSHDIIITTAQIPGMQAPVLIKTSMLEGMKPGSIILDLAVESGGNCEASKLGEVVEYQGVKIIGYPNLASRIARDASALYARNLLNFMTLLVSKETKQPHFDFEDQIIKGVTLTFEGKVVHETFKK